MAHPDRAPDTQPGPATADREFELGMFGEHFQATVLAELERIEQAIPA